MKADILVVDDTAANLKLLVSILGAQGYSVRPASSGTLALRSVEAKLPDLVLLDIRMPHMNGFEVCAKLKSDEASKHIPVIFISAADDVQDKVKAFSVGGVDYITKPFEPEEVLARISTHITLKVLQEEMLVQNEQLKALIQKQKEQEHIMIEQSKMAAMGEMISAIAHQWRQPLNALALYVQDIQGAYESGEINEEYIEQTVSKSMKQINYMSSTIDDFRNFFKPEKNEESFSVVEEITKTIELLKPQLKAHQIEITIVDDDYELIGYANEFQQIALNIINNAKDAIVQRQQKECELIGKINIVTLKSEDSLEVIFSDNGGGIAEDIIGKIFEPYFTTKFPQNGTGVGLYMVKEIIERHYKGRVRVQNIVQGAEFTLTIPLSHRGEKDV